MGRPKALLDIGDESLLARTIRIARSCVAHVVLVGQPPFELTQDLRAIRSVPDKIAGIGPIGGLAGVFNATNADRILLLACDMPHIEPILLERLIERSTRGDADAVVPVTRDGDRQRAHPCCAIYHRTSAPMVYEATEAGRYGMMRILDRLSVSWLTVDGDDAQFLANWNAPSDVTSQTAT